VRILILRVLSRSPVVLAKFAMLLWVLLSIALDGAAALALDGQRVVVTGGGRGIGKARTPLLQSVAAHLAYSSHSRTAFVRPQALALLCAEEGAEVNNAARPEP
jgi:hypothetical protein